VGSAAADDAAEGAQRFAASLGVVGQGVEPALHGLRRAQPRDDPPLGGGPQI